MNYFNQKQFIAEVDQQDTIIQQIDKWEAHKKGVLHRGFTIAIFNNNEVILQHRKHPVFNNVFDITISSHQIYENDALQDDLTAIYNTLEREWFIKPEDIDGEPKLNGNIYYKAKDPLSEYIEHEICHIYSCNVKKITLPNFEFAYGFSLHPVEEIKKPQSSMYPLLAPWVQKSLDEGIL